MLVTLILISALIAGGAVLLSVQSSANKSQDLTRSGMTALYCAEAGLTLSRSVVAANYVQWNVAGSMCTGPCTEPAWLAAGIGSHDLDGDMQPDFEIYIRDNADEAPQPDDPAVDTDFQVFIVSKCIKYKDTPKQIEELVKYDGGSSCYDTQLGGCNGGGGGPSAP